MIPLVSGVRPVEVLRRSADQIRRTARILAEITDETAGTPAERFGVLFPGQLPPEVEEMTTLREATILQAQRSFSARLGLAQGDGRR